MLHACPESLLRFQLPRLCHLHPTKSNSSFVSCRPLGVNGPTVTESTSVLESASRGPCGLQSACDREASKLLRDFPRRAFLLGPSVLHGAESGCPLFHTAYNGDCPA